MAFPMLFVFSNAFKPLDELFIFPPKFFPMQPTFDNFHDLVALLGDSWIPFSRYIYNSVAVTLLGTVGNVVVASMAAYMLSKHVFPGSKMLFQIVILSLMFAPSVTAMPSYIIMSRLGMINTLSAMILPSFASSLGLFLMKQFMDQMVPYSLLEAARLDGASEGCIFLRIVMPIVKPAWLTQIIFCFQTIWSNSGSGVIFDEDLKTLPFALGNIINGGIARAGVGSAVTMIMVLPPIIVFLLTQSNVMQTMSTSGIKD